MSGYTELFGGSSVQPTDVAYRAVALSASVELDWPALATDDNFLARIMDVTPSDVLLSISVPDARDASPGFDVVWRNLGAASFTVLDAAGNTLLTVASGEIKYLYLTGNSTAAGTWRTFTFGTGTSSADASALAGYGMRAISGTLNAAMLTTELNTNHTLDATDRGGFFVWTGGTGTITLPALADTYGDWFCGIRNQGSGALTISGASNIDGAASIVIGVGESFEVHAGPAQWYTEGRGRSASFNFTQLIKSVTGGTTVLTLSEAANVVQKYTGTLLSNQLITLPSVVQVYYISNQTAGSYSFTLQTAGGGTTVVVPQSQNIIVFCDGTNVINCSTTISGFTTINLGAGTVAAPALSFSTTDTGFYSPATYHVALSLNGVQKALFSSSAVTIVPPTTFSGAVTFSAGVTFSVAVVLANGSTATTQSAADNSTKVATTAYVDTGLALKANLASPTFTGTPAAPTAAPGTNTTQLATTAFVTAAAFSSSLPSQTGNAGKWITTDGSTASWAALTGLPSQTSNNGKFLTTDGSNASWAALTGLPSQTGNSGKFLTTDGSSASWVSSPVLSVQDQKSSGTGAQALTTGTYVTRELNTTLSNTITGASLNTGTGVITLPAGSYEVFATANAGEVIVASPGGHRLRLRNTTDSATLVFGTNCYSNNSSTNPTASLVGGFTLAGTKDIALQHYVATGCDGGTALGTGEVEVYSSMIIRQL